MGEQRVVIVGAGQGGFQAAASLRQEKFSGPITLIGEEPGAPYQRPPLSKAYLKDGDAGRLALRPAAFYESNAISYRDGVQISAIDRERREAVSSLGERFAYDHLILATGSRNRIPPIENLNLEGVLGIRTLADAQKLRARMPEIRHAIVVGGGFIGLEFAAVARAFGVRTTVVEGADRLMARAVSPAVSSFFRTAHEGWGAELQLNRFVSALLDDGNGAVAGVRLSDGAEIEGDTVIIAAGVQPNMELAAEAGLAVGDGVEVDALLQTSDPAISALGDCCSFPEPTRQMRVRLESVQAASDHARAIAKRLVGAPAPYAAAPWFWSDQGEHKLQIAGLSVGVEDFVVQGESSGKLIVYGFIQEELTCVETVGAPAEHMAARKVLNSARKVQKSDLSSSGYNLKDVARG